VPRTEELLLENDRAVLGLFAGNPFPAAPPRLVRAVLWQYWFSTSDQKHVAGVWWQRQFLGSYAPTLTLLSNGHFEIVDESTLRTHLRLSDPASRIGILFAGRVSAKKRARQTN
jgi:hypothetical protein